MKSETAPELSFDRGVKLTGKPKASGVEGTHVPLPTPTQTTFDLQVPAEP